MGHGFRGLIANTFLRLISSRAPLYLHLPLISWVWGEMYQAKITDNELSTAATTLKSEHIYILSLSKNATAHCKTVQILEFILKIYENWMKREGDQFQSTLYDKIVRELMTLGEITGVTSHAGEPGDG